MPTYAVDGVPLDDPAGRWMIERATKIPAAGNQRVELLDLPDRDGVVGVQRGMGTGQVGLSLALIADDAGVLDDSRQALLSALRAPKTLTWMPGGGRTRVADVIQSVIAEPSKVGSAAAIVSAALTVSPFWREGGPLVSPSIFPSVETEVRRNLAPVPQATAAWQVSYATGGSGNTSWFSDGRFAGGFARLMEVTTAPTSGSPFIRPPAQLATGMAVGETWVVSFKYNLYGGGTLQSIYAGGTNAPVTTAGPLVMITNGDGTITAWRAFTCTSLGAGSGTFWPYISLATAPVGTVFRAGELLVEKVPTFNGYFDGSGPISDLTPAWNGAANNSQSVLNSNWWTMPGWSGCTGLVADAVVRVGGPVGTVTFTGVDGRGLTVGPVAAGSYVYVDVARLSAWVTSGGSAWVRTNEADASGYIDWPIAGPLRLWPTGGDVRVAVASAGASGGATVAVRGSRWFL